MMLSGLLSRGSTAVPATPQKQDARTLHVPHPATLLKSLSLSQAEQVAEPGLPSQLEVRASAAEVAMVCRSRAGSVLRKQSILKCDHFPSSRNLKLAEQLRGAPNFRKVEGLPVYGTGQPTLPGCTEVLHTVCARGGGNCLRDEGACHSSQVLWINCREEAVLYINGRPYCVKDRRAPFANIENTGITAEQLVESELQLKREVLEESQLFNGHILLHGEAPPDSEEPAAKGAVYAYWEPAREVLCVHEVFEVLRHKFLSSRWCACRSQMSTSLRRKISMS